MNFLNNLLILIIFSYNIEFCISENNYCYSLDRIESQYHHFSTKTAYGFDGPKELIITPEQIRVPSTK